MGKIKIEKRKPVTIAYMGYKGPYNDIPFDSYIERLYGWAKEKRIRPGFYPLAVYHDNPETTAPEDCRTDVAITVVGEPQGTDEIMVRKMPAMTVASVKHKGGADEYQGVYEALARWVEENGYTWDGPPIEMYTRKPKVVDGKAVFHAKIMAPVRKK